MEWYEWVAWGIPVAGAVIGAVVWFSKRRNAPKWELTHFDNLAYHLTNNGPGTAYDVTLEPLGPRRIIDFPTGATMKRGEPVKFLTELPFSAGNKPIRITWTHRRFGVGPKVARSQDVQCPLRPRS